MVKSFIFERYLDVEPQIRQITVVLSAEVLKYYPELRKKKFFKNLFESAVMDENRENVLTTLKSLTVIMKNKDLKDFFKKFWKDNTKLLV